MKKRSYCLPLTVCFLLLAALWSDIFAQAYSIRVDTQNPKQPLQDLEFLQGATPLFDVYVRENGAKYTNLASKSCVFYYNTSATNTAFVTVTNSTTDTANGKFGFDFPVTATDTNGTFWYTALIKEGGSTYYSGTGSLYIAESTVTGSPGSLDLSTPLNWEGFVYYNTQDDGPVRVGPGISISTNADGSITLSAASANLWTGPGTTGTVTSTSVDTNKVLLGDGTWQTPSAGDITGVSATNPITGGGTSGDVGLGWDGSQSFEASGAANLNASSISSGSLDDARIPSGIARDSEVTALPISTFTNDSGYITTYVETDPNSIHTSGDNAMLGNLNGGGQSATNFASVAINDHAQIGLNLVKTNIFGANYAGKGNLQVAYDQAAADADSYMQLDDSPGSIQSAYWYSGKLKMKYGYGCMQLVSGSAGGVDRGFIIGDGSNPVYGSLQMGKLSTVYITNNASASIQLFYGDGEEYAYLPYGLTEVITVGASTASNSQSIVVGNGQTSHGTASITAGGNIVAGGGFLPSASNTVSLGSATLPFKDLFIGTNYFRNTDGSGSRAMTVFTGTNLVITRTGSTNEVRIPLP